MARSWREVLETNAWSLGQGAPNLAIPAALKDWALPLDQLPTDARRLYDGDPAAAKRLLAEAGHPGGLKIPVDTTPGYGPDFIDAVQVTARNWKSAGIEVDLKLKEYGVFISSAIFGKFDRMMTTLRGGTNDPDSYLFRALVPGQPLNAGGVNDPKLTGMIQLQRRTFDVAKRRDIIYDIQRHVAQQAWVLFGPSVSAVAAWEPHVKNFAPNIGHNYGGRLMAAWLDR